MPIKNATPEQIRAMRNRLQKKQADRQAETDMAEAVALVGRKNHPFVEAPDTEREKKFRAVGDLLILASIGSMGAICWNVADIRYGLVICLVSGLMAIKPALQAIK